MSHRQTCFVVILAAIIGAVGLRVGRLEQRPMHTDEAVQAFKFGELLEEGEYHYNRREYHGPTLNYFTLIPAWLGCAEDLTEVSEFSLRIVPVFFGILLVVLVFLLADGLGRPAAIGAAVLTAISPAMVFYSRYYIHEMLMVCFTFGVIGFGWRYAKSGNIWWALGAGISAGLMHATKETCVISLASMGCAFLIVRIVERQKGDSVLQAVRGAKPYHLILAIAAGAAVSVLFYSSFFSNPGGVVDSLRAYQNYFVKGCQNQLHAHSWYYYLKTLIYSRYGDGPVWSEAFIVLLAGMGFIAVVRRKGISGVDWRLVRFIGFYTVIMTVVYSAIRYKTPWCLLSFMHGMILLAGVGAVVLVKMAPNVFSKSVICILLCLGGAHLAVQAYLGSYKYYAETSNPYVYAHTGTDIHKISQRVEGIADAHREGRDMRISVVCTGDAYWPLPWYLRSFANVSWRSEVGESVAAAPVIIASADLEDEIVKALYEVPKPGEINLYVPLFDSYTELRPQVELRGYVRKELWDNYQRSIQQTGERK